MTGCFVPLSACELDDLRDTIGATLPDLCDIQQRSWTTRNGFGGTTPTTTATQSNVPCRVTTRPGAPAGDPSAPGQHEQSWTVDFAYGTNIGPEDRVVYQGHTLRVVGVGSPASELLLLTVNAEEVAP